MLGKTTCLWDGSRWVSQPPARQSLWSQTPWSRTRADPSERVPLGPLHSLSTRGDTRPRARTSPAHPRPMVSPPTTDTQVHVFRPRWAVNPAPRAGSSPQVAEAALRFAGNVGSLESMSERRAQFATYSSVPSHSKLTPLQTDRAWIRSKWHGG